MPKILIFIDWFLPGFRAGGPTRSIANLVDALHQDAELFIITRNTDYCQTEPYPGIKPNAWVNFENKARVYYFSEQHYSYSNLKKLIETTPFDIAYVNGIYSLKYSILPLFICRRINKKVVVAVRGMLSCQAFSSKSVKKKSFIYISKWLGMYKKATIQATSPQEVEDVKKCLGSKVTIMEVSNFPRMAQNDEHDRINKAKGELRMVNIARISPEKNQLFAIERLAKFNTEGMVLLDLYGPVYNADYWERCREEIKKLPENIHVQYKGILEPDDLESTLAGYHFLLFPSTGENFGHTIFEALSCARPVIVSDQTPWRALESQSAGFDLNLGQTQKWLDVLQYCLDIGQEDFDKLSIGAKKLAIAYIQQSDLKNKYLQLFTP
ncbi:MAG: glycosyltransferase [Cyclobacteriaceae bacterium]|nr:glycosyltransferase [Cyclobacteriaceae bacterium]